jgi:hypothetical protein
MPKNRKVPDRHLQKYAEKVIRQTDSNTIGAVTVKLCEHVSATYSEQCSRRY